MSIGSSSEHPFPDFPKNTEKIDKNSSETKTSKPKAHANPRSYLLAPDSMHNLSITINDSTNLRFRAHIDSESLSGSSSDKLTFANFAFRALSSVKENKSPFVIISRERLRELEEARMKELRSLQKDVIVIREPQAEPYVRAPSSALELELESHLSLVSNEKKAEELLQKQPMKDLYIFWSDPSGQLMISYKKENRIFHAEIAVTDEKLVMTTSDEKIVFNKIKDLEQSLQIHSIMRPKQ